jgi:hypothetical protein
MSISSCFHCGLGGTNDIHLQQCGIPAQCNGVDKSLESPASGIVSNIIHICAKRLTAGDSSCTICAPRVSTTILRTCGMEMSGVLAEIKEADMASGVIRSSDGRLHGVRKLPNVQGVTARSGVRVTLTWPDKSASAKRIGRSSSWTVSPSKRFEVSTKRAPNPIL